MRSRFKVLSEGAIYFITSTIVEWIPVFTANAYFQILIQALKFSQEKKSLEIFGYVVMENHFHALVRGPQLSGIMQSMKSFTSKQLIEQLQQDNKEWLLNQLYYYRKKYKIDSTYQLWQEGFHPQLIGDENMLLQKLAYMHHNPVRRGYVACPEHWQYSSARNYYLDDESILGVERIGPV